MIEIKKHTPVHWFALQLGITNGTLLETAMEIEKEHIINAYKEADTFPQDYHDAEDYYKKNYLSI